ncbi:hypothetical protein KUTeg_012906 [Tegillarca granosa]|uniref:Ion transport domain-containing protein n=1 Tax=Tegillarca granosa TaxID=220873 RepID=A0ABQ9ES38_TEGGR|nr:hypothetical protein KUTeg_012906 [Tegillarca granosa]
MNTHVIIDPMATEESVPTVEGPAPTIDIEVIGDTSTDLDHHTPDVVQVPQAAQKSKDGSRNLSNIDDTKIEVEENEVKDDVKNVNKTKKSLSKHSSREHLDEKEIQEEDVILAATLVQDAKEGRNFDFKTEPGYVRSYNLFHRFYLRWLLYFFIMIDLLLALVEKPTKPGWEIPYWGSMLIEVVCLVYFSFRFGHSMHFTKRGVFWRDTKNILILVIIIIRRAFRNIRRTVPEILNVLILFLLSVLLFALLALKLFTQRSNLEYPGGDKYFRNYFDSIWDLYVLVTTANNPDVMMPAYDENNWFALFFVIYLIICLYIFMSIVLAAIYNNYRKNLKNEIKAAVYMKRRKLAQAFEILKMERAGQFVITYHTWNQLMKIVTPSKIRSQFLRLADLLELELSEVKDRLTFIEQKFPYIYNSTISLHLRRIVRHKYFRFFFDFMIFVNAWFIGYKEFSTLDSLLVLRVVRLIKIFGSIQRFKVILMTIINIGPSIITYGGVIFIFYYIFAIIGMEVFHGLIKFYGYDNASIPFCGNEALKGTAFVRNHYCNNNFNDILRSFVVLFDLMVVNHIFIAFILEAFILEYSLQRIGKFESFVESKIKELGLDSKKVEVLLQQMFEGEIDPEDEGPEAGMEIPVKRPRTITLDTVA